MAHCFGAPEDRLQRLGQGNIEQALKNTRLPLDLMTEEGRQHHDRDEELGQCAAITNSLAQSDSTRFLASGEKDAVRFFSPSRIAGMNRLRRFSKPGRAVVRQAPLRNITSLVNGLEDEAAKPIQVCADRSKTLRRGMTR